MATVRSSLDPTPAQGLAYDLAKLSPVRWTGTKSGAQTATAGVARFTNDTGETLVLSKVKVNLGTAPTGSSFIVDVHKNGTTVFSAQAGRPTVAATTKSAEAVPAVTGDKVTVAPGDVLTVDVDQIGSTVAGSDLTVTIEAIRGRSGDEDRTVTDEQLAAL